MSVEERNQYETEWKIYNDYFNTIDSAKREGRAEGRAEGHAEGRAEGMKEGRAEGRSEAMKETARNLKRIGVQTEIIMHATGLSAEEIDAL